MNEWFLQLKKEIMSKYLYKEITHKVLLDILINNPIVLKNETLNSYFHSICEYMNLNSNILEIMICHLKDIEDNDLSFLIEDIEVYVMCVKENIVIERRMLKSFFDLLKWVLNINKDEDFVNTFVSRYKKYAQDMDYNYQEFSSLLLEKEDNDLTKTKDNFVKT